MMYMALDMGISAVEFWNEFTPRGILLLARQRVKIEKRNAPARPGTRPKSAPMPKIARIPR